jgi:hypothetical protein
MADFEAQLVAAALAAAQANVVSGPGVDTAGVIFLVRLVGPTFSFYSVDPSVAFLEVFQDYSNLGEGKKPPCTTVHKCEFTFPADGEERTFTEFSFHLPDHREVVIDMLEWIRLRIIQ